MSATANLPWHWQKMLDERNRREWRAAMDRAEAAEIFHRFDPQSGCACWACIARLQLWIIRSRSRGQRSQS
jgi:hypothetical protein